MTDDPPSTHALLARAAAGDDQAFDQLARAVWPDIRRWALLELGDAAAADDASQETLLRLLRSVGTLDAERPIEGWLRTVVRNCCRDLRRREGRAARPAPEPEAGGDLERAFDLRRGAQAAIDAYQALTPRQREVWDLVDRQGLASA
jgi:RNA polymerase sigma-70 factor (ECF subfamily)